MKGPSTALSQDLSPRVPGWLFLPQLRRGLFIWAPVHILVWLFLLGLGYSDSIFASSPSSALLIAAVTAALAAVDARIMREPLFYANMGVPRWLPAAAGAVAAAAMEIVMSGLGVLLAPASTAVGTVPMPW